MEQSMSQSSSVGQQASVPSGRPQGAPQGAGGPAVQRQFVNFAAYKLDPLFRRLPSDERETARKEFSTLIEQRREGLICLSYSLVGLRPEVDFLLWRIGVSTDVFQE